MFNQNRKTLLCLFMGVFCICSRLEAEEGMTQAATATQKIIASFAETMEVFPLGIITDGKGSTQNGSTKIWDKRYELTFEHYRRFYEFKEFALSISESNFIRIIEGFKSATPKEKALMMTMIYIYERVHRSRVAARGGGRTWAVDKHFLRFGNERVFFETRWNKWVSLIESHKDDPTVAFPAVVADEKVLKKEWEEDTEKTIQQLYKQLSSCGLSELYEQWFSRRLQERIYDISSETPLIPTEFFLILYGRYNYEELKPLEVFAEFFYWQYLPTMPLGSIPPSGNSSAKPKTLGDIATQILKSRLSYEEE